MERAKCSRETGHTARAGTGAHHNTASDIADLERAKCSQETGHTARAGTGARRTAPDIAASVRKSSRHTGRTGTGPPDSPSDIAPHSMDHFSERAGHSWDAVGTGTGARYGSPLVKAKGRSGDLIPLAI
jgi:hypothetical protein